MSDPSSVSPLDPGDMLGIVRDQPAQWLRAVELFERQPAPQLPTPRAVVIGGMGGSGVGGDIARVATERFGRAPVVAVKGYRLPAWAGPDTPMIAVSHSGNTEETLELVREGLDAGLRVHAITSGGALGAMAREGRVTVTTVPGGMQPRASLPSLVAPVLGTLERWGVLGSLLADVAKLPDAMAPLLAQDRAGTGEAQRLAAAIKGTVPVFLGGRGVGALVALRAAAQVAENAEEPAFHAELPEFDHNALVGLATEAGATAFTLVAVRDPREHGRVAARFAPTLEGLRPGVRAIEEFQLVDGDWLVRLACGILEVDLLSVHLALALRRDPTPVDILVNLKTTLAATP